MMLAEKAWAAGRYSTCTNTSHNTCLPYRACRQRRPTPSCRRASSRRRASGRAGARSWRRWRSGSHPQPPCSTASACCCCCPRSGDPSGSPARLKQEVHGEIRRPERLTSTSETRIYMHLHVHVLAHALHIACDSLACSFYNCTVRIHLVR